MMNKNKIVIAITLLMGLLLAAFMFSWYQQQSSGGTVTTDNKLERTYSPSFGPESAKVTIVEFFDPACEACRAFYPFVKKMMDENPNDIRLVLRYAAFHKGSDEVVLMLESARRQGIYNEVLVPLLARQNAWASHGSPSLSTAWEIAEEAGLDIVKAREDMKDPDLIRVLEQDTADIKSLGIQKTPTFFVNGKPLETFGSQQLYDLVQSELE
ncbi:thioredoxin domain-containing protein [Vibrio sp. qd031]|uniref:DsbA family protein n=1 Tax=Vibrio sp. qd031 TaxID=1603038 RepID=UPI001F5BA38B|nr:thioredoxin domain-containing protein [Vibrio sp. qd031]